MIQLWKRERRSELPLVISAAHLHLSLSQKRQHILRVNYFYIYIWFDWQMLKIFLCIGRFPRLRSRITLINFTLTLINCHISAHAYFHWLVPFMQVMSIWRCLIFFFLIFLPCLFFVKFQVWCWFQESGFGKACKWAWKCFIYLSLNQYFCMLKVSVLCKPNIFKNKWSYIFCMEVCIKIHILNYIWLCSPFKPLV